MKIGIIRLTLLAAVCAGGITGFTSCQRPRAEVAEEPEPPAPSTPIPAATPAPTPPLAAATPVPDPLAAPGIFYLLQKASITTDEGIVGLKPGQGLRQISPGIYEANGRTIELADHQVTNNLRIARQFATAEMAAQASLRQTLLPKATPLTHATPSPPTPAPVAAARPVGSQTNSLSSGPRLGGGTGVADPETANRKNVRVDSSGRQYWRDSRGGIRYDF